MRTEPRTILNFLSNYFDIIKELFDVQLKDGLVRREDLNAILAEHDSDILNKLIEYIFFKKIGTRVEATPKISFIC
jgi:Ca2+-binding EF-hand superfamily protein